MSPFIGYWFLYYTDLNNLDFLNILKAPDLNFLHEPYNCDSTFVLEEVRILMSVCAKDLKNVVSKMLLTNHTSSPELVFLSFLLWISRALP